MNQTSTRFPDDYNGRPALRLATLAEYNVVQAALVEAQVPFRTVLVPPKKPKLARNQHLARPAQFILIGVDRCQT